jgi:fucose permease
LLAVYWAAIMLARIVLSRVLLKAKGPGVVAASAIGSAIGVAVLMSAHSALVAGIGIALTGASFASIYPTVLGLAGARFEKYSGTVFGLMFAVALCGGMLMPWLAGHVAESAGLRSALGLGILGACMIFVLQVVIARRIRD